MGCKGLSRKTRFLGRAGGRGKGLEALEEGGEGGGEGVVGGAEKVVGGEMAELGGEGGGVGLGFVGGDGDAGEEAGRGGGR